MIVVTDALRACSAVMDEIGLSKRRDDESTRCGDFEVLRPCRRSVHAQVHNRSDGANSAVMSPTDTPCFAIFSPPSGEDRCDQPGRTTEFKRGENRAKIGSDPGLFFEKMIE
jgi:hypothetical protein